MTLEPRVCACNGCDEWFTPNKFYPTQKYCCKKCSDAQYYADHREEITQYKKQYRADHREEITQYSKQRHADHREYFKQYNKQYRADHREEITQYKKQYRADHREEQNEGSKQYRADHPEVIRAIQHRRRARLNGNGGDHTAQDERDLLNSQEALCFYCNTPLYSTLDPRFRHVEHVVEIAKGGSNDPYNLVYACRDCNYAKHRLAGCAEAELNDLFKKGIINLDEAFYKSQTLKTNREFEINQLIWIYRTKRDIFQELNAE